MKKLQIKADLMLLMVALFWGGSYLLIDYSLEELDPFNINALRFIIAFIVAFALARRRLLDVNRITIKYASLLGFILMVVYFGATFGVKYTSLSNAGFLCALTVVVTPIFGFFFKKQRPEKKLLIAVILALLGIAFLTLDESLKPASGDLLCILCAVAYAVHLLITESAVKKEDVNVFQLGVYQLGFCGVYQLLLSFITENPRFPSSGKVWFSVLILSIFCTGISFVVQTVAQQYTSASHVGVIFSLEPVFAALVAFFIAGEILSGRAYFGAVLLLISLFVMEIDFKKLLKESISKIHALRNEIPKRL
ncbi:MAG TPA: DMT family transporter [Anaerovoracaceae bacterium]|nr:DMT family transporter [Anaerovoracaceae bacterium]